MGYSKRQVREFTLNDLVKLNNSEPNVSGKIIEVVGVGEKFLVKWSDGITVEHFAEELRLLRLDEITPSVMSFLTY